MNRNLLLTLRQIRQKPTFFLINILGLTIALSAVLFIYSYNYHHWHYDTFHSNADRIYRITMDMNQGESSMYDARLYSGYADYISSNFPHFEKITKFTSFGKAIVSLDQGENFYSDKVFGVDSSFFDVFDYPIISGQRETMFTHPEQVAVTRSVALTYFKSLDVIGKQVTIQHGKEDDGKRYTISGVLEDFPDNTHFKAEWLCTLSALKTRSLWLYTYAVVSPETSVKSLEHSLDTLFAEENYHPIFNLQRIDDIHLNSHKTRELEPGGNQGALYLLFFGALIIYLMAVANIFNLNTVQFLKNQPDYGIRKLHGANSRDLVGEALTEKLFLVVVSAVVSVLIFAGVSIHFQLKTYHPELWANYLLLLVALLVAALIFAIVPIFWFYSRMSFQKFNVQRIISFRLLFIFQFILSITVLSSVLVMHKQIGMIHQLHPGAKANNLVVIPHVPSGVAGNYDLLKENLLKHPEIIDITAAMEEPAGNITDNFGFTLEGFENKENRTLNVLCIDSNFFSFFGIHALAGNINPQNTASQEWENKVLQLNEATQQNNTAEINRLTPLVSGYREKYILNKAALDYLGITNPEEVIGKRFEIDFSIPYLFPAGEICGVVSNFHYTNLYKKEKPLMIVTRKIFSRNYICRIDTSNTAKALATINTEWKKINPDAPFEYEFIDDSYRRVYQNEYTQTKVLSLFDLIALFISVLGMYALITFQLERQTKEIGIRKVVGAKIFEIIWMHSREVMRWVGVAIIIAAPIAYFVMNQWLQNFAYKTSLNWWIFALAGLIALVVALLTVSWQSLRAATRNPVEALRYE